MSKKKKVAVGLVALLVALQLVPVDRTNPAVTGEVPAPDDVRALLRAACYDCHSNETVWPWYTRVAPVSLLAAHDVEEGREYVNFSEWDRLDAAGRQHAYEEVVEVLEEGEMPLWFYTPLHPEADLDEEQVATLVAWAKAGLAE